MEIKGNNYNYGIAFIKVFFSFCVVCCHYWEPDIAGSYFVQMMYRMRAIAVPIFVIMSFFLTEKIFADKDTKKIRKRVWRLLFPHISWAVLYFLGYRIIDVLLKYFGFSIGLSVSYKFKDLLWQIFFGHSRYLCPPLWYLFALIVINVLLWVIFRYCGRYSWKIIIMLGIAVLWIQYSGINYKLFGGYEFELRYPLGRLAEVFPVACIGLLLAHSKILEKIKNQRVYVVLICIMSMLVIAYGGLFTSPAEGFGYGGTYAIAYSTTAFILFYEFPFEKMWIGIKKTLKFLSKYSFGVFCIHLGVGYCWNNVLCVYFGWERNTFIQCICIYIICIFVSWMISHIPVKYVKQLVE